MTTPADVARTLSPLPPRPFHLLLVCTANLCRSPLAEVAFTGITPCSRGDVVVTSAGTHAVDGLPVDRQTGDIARGLGLDLEGHRATTLTAGLVEESDLVLGLTRDHRSAAARLCPAAAPRIFTLREFAHTSRSASHSPPPAPSWREHTNRPLAPAGGPFSRSRDASTADELRAVVAAVAGARGVGPRLEQADFDVIDPFGRDAETYLLTTAQIFEAVLTISAQLSTLRSRLRHPAVTAERAFDG